MFKLKFFVISILLGFVASDDKYCADGLCYPGNPHIGCGHSGDFADTCPEDRHILKLSKDEIQAFLDHHNANRHKIANGEEPGFNPAIRMATMVN